MLVVFALFTFLGVGDEDARFRDLGHHLMCVCGCNQTVSYTHLTLPTILRV